MGIIITIVVILVGLYIPLKPEFEINLEIDEQYNNYQIYISYLWYNDDDEKIRKKTKLFKFRKKLKNK